MNAINLPPIDHRIGNTPLVSLQRLPARFGVPKSTVILGKLEGNNPAGSVKDRPALYMIDGAEKRGEIKPGDTLIEATSGNTGIALAMVAAIRGYKMTLIMPDDLSVERRQAMTAYGAKLILTPAAKGGMEFDQFSNPDCPRAHYEGTGPEIAADTHGRVTHFVSAMGTTGTIMGVAQYLNEHIPAAQIIGCRPTDGSKIPGIRKWPEAYLPKIFDASRVHVIEEVTQADAEVTMRALAKEEGIFCGVSAGGAAAVALRIAQKIENGVIVFIVCDRGDRYLSTGVFA
jgi:S-sulfo-L-cysteine synthase (O-acetyl-L-serine-dependent)